MKVIGTLAFFVYSNIFIAICAVLMVNQTYELLLHHYPDYYFLAFVFFATICSYSFHWYLTFDLSRDSPRIKWVAINRKFHLVFFIVGLAGALYCTLFLFDHWHWLLFSAFITFLYSAPKIPHPVFSWLLKIARGKTFFLAMVWMYVTTILPVQVSDSEWEPVFFIFAASRFSFIYAICIIFDYRDRDHDKAIGIRSLVTLLNQKQITYFFITSLTCFLVFTCLMLFYGYSYLVITILLSPGIIVAALYKHSLKSSSDILYYFVLDGLMGLSPSIMFLFPVLYN